MNFSSAFSQRMLDQLREGDTVVVWRLERDRACSVGNTCFPLAASE